MTKHRRTKYKVTNLKIVGIRLRHCEYNMKAMYLCISGVLHRQPLLNRG